MSFIRPYSSLPVASQYFTFDTSPADAKHKRSLYVYNNEDGYSSVSRCKNFKPVR